MLASKTWCYRRIDSAVLASVLRPAIGKSIQKTRPLKAETASLVYLFARIIQERSWIVL
jgi:hypothetical protein